jgi:hypothetical protein
MYSITRWRLAEANAIDEFVEDGAQLIRGWPAGHNKANVHTRHSVSGKGSARPFRREMRLRVWLGDWTVADSKNRDNLYHTDQ